MSESVKVYASPNVVTPSKPVVINPDVCIGCNTCVRVCMNDIFIPNPEKGKPPIIIFPDECWACGACVMECPMSQEGVEQSAIEVNWPPMRRMRWKRKETGEHFRVGMPNPPAPNLKPPCR